MSNRIMIYSVMNTIYSTFAIAICVMLLVNCADNNGDRFRTNIIVAWVIFEISVLVFDDCRPVRAIYNRALEFRRLLTALAHKIDTVYKINSVKTTGKISAPAQYHIFLTNWRAYEIYLQRSAKGRYATLAAMPISVLCIVLLVYGGTYRKINILWLLAVPKAVFSILIYSEILKQMQVACSEESKILLNYMPYITIVTYI